MQVTLYCVSCASALPVDAARVPGELRCGRCQRVMSLDWTLAASKDEEVDRCPLCRGADFYTRKDFDPKLGLAVVVAGALASAGFYWFGLDLMAYGVLAGAVLIDLLVYRRLGEVTVCYRCHAEFRGSYKRTAPAFDLHTADVLEHEWARRKERI